VTVNDTPTVDRKNHHEIINRIQAGEVFVYPTDTAYGLGASIRNREAVQRIFELKDRPLEKTVPVLTTAPKAREMVTIEDPEKRATETLWPGGLTLVLEVTVPEEYPPGLVRDGTMALRAPGREYLRDVLAAAPPIVGTSANPSGGQTPYESEDLEADLLSKVDFRVSGEAGGKDSSTVAEWNDGTGEWVIRRTEPVRQTDLEEQTAMNS
jgi:L-threonylcarbamoyladenylate synthase